MRLAVTRCVTPTTAGLRRLPPPRILLHPSLRCASTFGMASDSKAEGVPAIRVAEFGAPEVLKMGTVVLPDLKPEQVLIDVHAASVNPVDTYIRAGAYARKPTLPYTPGGDGAGIVVSVGSAVTNVKVGQRVMFIASDSGSYAHRTVCNSAMVAGMPDSLSFVQAAGVGVAMATAYRSLFQIAKAKPAEWVLVHGASGGVGAAAVQMAAAAGMHVIGTAGSASGLEAIRELGAHIVVNHHDADSVTQIMTATGGRGVDVVLEMLANVNLGKDLTALAPGGRVVVIGCRGEVNINPRDLMAREASIHGVTLFRATASDVREMFAYVNQAMTNGILKPQIGETLPLESAAEAHKRVIDHPGGASGKIVLVTRPDEA